MKFSLLLILVIVVFAGILHVSVVSSSVLTTTTVMAALTGGAVVAVFQLGSLSIALLKYFHSLYCLLLPRCSQLRRSMPLFLLTLSSLVVVAILNEASPLAQFNETCIHSTIYSDALSPSSIERQIWHFNRKLWTLIDNRERSCTCNNDDSESARLRSILADEVKEHKIKLQFTERKY